MDEATLEALEDYARSEKFSQAERAALGAAVALTREPRALPPAVDAQLREHYDEGARIELVAVIGLYNYVNRLSNGLRVEADVTPERCEP